MCFVSVSGGAEFAGTAERYAGALRAAAVVIGPERRGYTSIRIPSCLSLSYFVHSDFASYHGVRGFIESQLLEHKVCLTRVAWCRWSTGDRLSLTGTG